MSRLQALRHRGGRTALGGFFPALALTALIALSSSGAAAAGVTTRTFTASYDASGSFNYNARGSHTDTGCFMSLGGANSYGFDQLWRVKVGFKRQRKGAPTTKIESIKHLDGPQALGHTGSSHLMGKQTAVGGDCFSENVGGPDVGTFDCKSGAPTLTAFNNPQMEISREGEDLVVLGRAFLEAHLNYSGTDTIPSEMRFSGGCAFFNDDWAFGSTMLPGDFATSKVSLPVNKLFHLGRGKSLTEKVGLGENTEHRPQQTCATTFGTPHLCIVNGQSLKGTFRWGRAR
jgi:hypothetical protein